VDGIRKNGTDNLAVASRGGLRKPIAATDMSGGALRTPESALHAYLRLSAVGRSRLHLV
jgi:hypothetical protein